MAAKESGRRAAANRSWWRYSAIGALALCASAVLVVHASPASARRWHQRPRLSWRVDRAVAEGQPISVSWTGRHLGRGHKLLIQRPVGTAHVWKTIAWLSADNGSGELPGMALGRYRLRLADFVRAHRSYWRGGRRHRRTFLRLAAKRVVGIGVFGPVPFSTLFGNEVENYVYTTPNASFPYVREWETLLPWDNPIFAVEHNHCTAAHIDFVLGESDEGTGTVTLVQESREAVSSTADHEVIGSLDAALVPGQSWSVNGATTTNPEIHISNLYINGYAVCDSTESFFS